MRVRGTLEDPQDLVLGAEDLLAAGSDYLSQCIVIMRKLYPRGSAGSYMLNHLWEIDLRAEHAYLHRVVSTIACLPSLNKVHIVPNSVLQEMPADVEEEPEELSPPCDPVPTDIPDDSQEPSLLCDETMEEESPAPEPIVVTSTAPAPTGECIGSGELPLDQMPTVVLEQTMNQAELEACGAVCDEGKYKHIVNDNPIEDPDLLQIKRNRAALHARRYRAKRRLQKMEVDCAVLQQPDCRAPKRVRGGGTRAQPPKQPPLPCRAASAVRPHTGAYHSVLYKYAPPGRSNVVELKSDPVCAAVSQAVRSGPGPGVVEFVDGPTGKRAKLSDQGWSHARDPPGEEPQLPEDLACLTIRPTTNPNKEAY